jgi:branched-chain amino acid transport system ATP-binding protein
VTAMIEVKGLMVYYENAIAINNLSIEVKEGEIVGVLGSNSAGKSTLMYTLSGLIFRLKEIEDRSGGVRIEVLGQIKFEGEDITYKSATDRVKRGIVSTRERHPIFKDLNVVENLKVASYIHRKTATEDFEHIFIIFPALKKMEGRRAGLMSGGEQQMLSIGMALMAKPRLLLLDEPLLGLSPILQVELVRAINRTRETGVTVLVTEQFARPLIPIIDRGYVIENGMLVLSGTGSELAVNPEVKAAYFGL